MLNCVHSNSNTGENPDVDDNVTGVIQPYKEYVDKRKVGIPEDSFEVEVQGCDSHIDQDVMGITKNPF